MMKHFFMASLATLFNAQVFGQLIINELSQGATGAKEYVELLVTGNPVCGGSNTVDLRGWIIDDNNSWHATGSGTGIAGGHVKFDSIPQWANVKIGTLILIYNDADMSSAVSALPVDTTDVNGDCVYIIPISSGVLLKNITLPVSNGSMTTYAVPGNVYTTAGNWICLGMANSNDAFHVVNPANYAVPYHAIGWGNNTNQVNIYYGSSQGGYVIYMANSNSNDPFDAANYVDTTATTNETPGLPNNAANAAWIQSLNNNCQPFTPPIVSFNNPGGIGCGNATVTITATSGTPGATFSWSNNVQGSNNTVSNAGMYYVTVTDAGGICSNIDSISITSSGSLVLSATSTDASCGTSNGSAEVTATVGTATDYLWSTGAVTSVINNLSAGTYTVTVTGSGSCTATASVTVSGSGTLAINATAVGTTCGNSNGSVSVTVTSGTAISFLWSNGANSASVSNLPAGTYTVTVDAGGGCTATASAIVNGSGNNSVSIQSADSIFCSGDSTEICAPLGFVSYLWNTGATSSCIQAKNAGNYRVTVTDNANCTATSNTIPLAVYPLPPVSVSVNGDTLRAFNAVTYQWFLNGTEIAGANSPVYVAQQAGSYQVAVTDSVGCRAFSNAVTIVVGIEDGLELAEVLVYPNPLSGGNWVVQTSPAFIGSQLEFMDNNGRVVYSTYIHSLFLEVTQDFASGIYVMKLQKGDRFIVKKLAKL